MLNSLHAMNRIRLLSFFAVAFLLPWIAGGAQAGAIFASTEANVHIGDFGTLDTTTGVYTPLGDNGITLAGIGTRNGVLYGAARNTSTGTLYSINTGNGSLTAIGSSNISYLDFAVAKGALWAVGMDDNLYSINSASGAATLIGPTGLAASLGNWNSLANGVNGLFFDLTDNLYSLNDATGAATLIGCTSPLVFGVCSGPQMGAMGASSGTLYGIDNSVSQLYSVNTGTGVDTALGVSITGNFGHFTGLSEGPGAVHAVPEPGSLALFLAGLCGLGLIHRRKASA